MISALSVNLQLRSAAAVEQGEVVMTPVYLCTAGIAPGSPGSRLQG